MRRRYHALSGVSSQPLASMLPRSPVPVINEVPLEMRRLAGMDGIYQQGIAHTLSGLSQQGLAHTLSGGCFNGGLGEDTPPPSDFVTLTSISDQNKQILKKIDAQDRARKMATFFGVAGAVFAAFRLGILAFPTVREQIRRYK
jgi:hypothetical protein